jgi:anti-sigma B factor antagonist
MQQTQTFRVNKDGSSLNVRSREKDGVTVVKLDGDIDVTTSHRFEKLLFGYIGPETKSLIVDIDDLDFIDTSGLTLILKAFKRCRREGAEYKVVCGNHLRKLFSLSRLDEAFPVYENHWGCPGYVWFE